MENNNPKISVIMSVYNGEKYLREAIESILNQTFTDFEFLIVNDGSTDKTSEILKEYSQRDNKIKIINNSENIGLTRSLNKAIKLSKGKYIARIDANDISLPKRLEAQFNFMEKNPHVGLVSSYTQFIDEEDNPLDRINRPAIEMNPRRLFFDSQICHSSIMIRKKILDRIGNYDEKFLYSQDSDLTFRIFRIAKIAVVPEVLILWREQKSSISTKKRLAQIKYGSTARARAIHSNLYPKYYYLFLPLFFIKPFIPAFIKRFLRKIL